jgi:hypothetical protein
LRPLSRMVKVNSYSHMSSLRKKVDTFTGQVQPAVDHTAPQRCVPPFSKPTPTTSRLQRLIDSLIVNHILEDTTVGVVAHTEDSSTGSRPGSRMVYRWQPCYQPSIMGLPSSFTADIKKNSLD